MERALGFVVWYGEQGWEPRRSCAGHVIKGKRVAAEDIEIEDADEGKR